MKKIFLSLFLFGCTGSLPPSVIDAVPKAYDINAPMFSHAKDELLELVSACGPGIVKGAAGENRCSYQVAIDDLLLTHPSDKTGMIHNENWAYQDGVEFLTPKREVVPDSFDLRDLMKGGQPQIKKQQCGDCWAWASHHGYEIAQAIHDSKAVDNSVQAVLSCSHEGTCGGGFMSAVDFIKNGLPLEGDFPYKNGVTGTCKYSSAELSKGWDPKVLGTPYIGSSLSYSREFKAPDGSFASRPTVQEMQSAMFQWKSPLVVTVDAYSVSGDGVVDSCSAINSGGNHMVTIVGWDNEGGHINAHVWNSWGPAHGKNGVSRIKWECGAGKLNRGLGVEAKIVQYKPACDPPVVEIGKAKHILFQGNAVKLGKAAKNQKCQWAPADGLSDPNSCETYASPVLSTEYHMVGTNDCGTASAMTLVEVWGPKGKSQQLRTIHKTVNL